MAEWQKAENYVFNELDETAKHWYRENLDKAGLIDDPYVMQEQGIDSVNW